MEEVVPLKFSGKDTRLIEEGFKLASEAHRYAPARASGEPYFWHPVRCAKNVIIDQFHLGIQDAKVIVACLIHDTVEDAREARLNPLLVRQNIEKRLGPEVAYHTLLLTKHREGTKQEYLHNLARCNEFRVLWAKLRDRCDNLSTLASMPRDKQVAKARETHVHFPALIDRFQFLIERETSNGNLIEPGWLQLGERVTADLKEKLIREQTRLGLL